MTTPPNAENPNSPEPATTPGLESGSGVQPGDTPPNAGQMSGTAPDAGKTPNTGPVSGTRTPMIVFLVLLGLMVLGVVGYGIAQIVTYAGGDVDEESLRAVLGLAAR